MTMVRLSPFFWSCFFLASLSFPASYAQQRAVSGDPLYAGRRLLDAVSQDLDNNEQRCRQAYEASQAKGREVDLVFFAENCKVVNMCSLMGLQCFMPSYMGMLNESQSVEKCSSLRKAQERYIVLLEKKVQPSEIWKTSTHNDSRSCKIAANKAKLYIKTLELKAGINGNQ